MENFKKVNIEFMKRQKPKFKEGDIIIKSSNNWKRKIRNIEYEERSGVMKVMYFYYNEELNVLYEATGNFDYSRIGYCSQDHLLSWQKGN